MLVTIWMWTQEWSLISMRLTAFTFATCHHALSWSSRLTRSIRRRSFWLPRTGTLMRIRATASLGVSLASCRASAETGLGRGTGLDDSGSTAGSIRPAGPGSGPRIRRPYVPGPAGRWRHARE
jgi:hypothetical protein